MPGSLRQRFVLVPYNSTEIIPLVGSEFQVTQTCITELTTYKPSLVPQPPSTRVKESGNIMYELAQTQGCGATNHITFNTLNVDYTRNYLR